MNRYIAFAANEDTTGGGWVDYLGSYNTSYEAKEAIMANKEYFDWGHIIDSETETMVLFGFIPSTKKLIALADEDGWLWDLEIKVEILEK
jgi:hypothetical protein